MKKLFLLLMFFAVSGFVFGQTKTGIKIGYIDMDYILENVPDYKEASSQLEQKAQKWKQDIEERKNAIQKLKESLKNERALYTKELIEEKEEEIKFLETDLIDYQQKRFGPRGDLAIQKETIIKPVQDQVFNTIQDIAEAKQYDFIFDKSSDMTILFSAKKHNISDQVVRVITRTEKREELSKKQQKALEEKQEKQDEVSDNSALAERQRLLDEKKAKRDKILEDRRKTAEEKRKIFEENRKKLIEERNKQISGTTIDSSKTDVKPAETKTADKQTENFNKAEDKKAVQDSLKTAKEAERLKAIENNKKVLEERRKALEEKRKKILEEREAARKAKEEELKKKNNQN
ncbi:MULTISPECIES: OmpH family outer membrane protein [unclassified Flavobacterium]|uniref:OmpH family outer membrane protein n=1 Tax=unclassified Flavobacterium TaxID=196869 RepID=UPI00361C24A1